MTASGREACNEWAILGDLEYEHIGKLAHSGSSRFNGEYVDGEADWGPEYPQGTSYICDFSGRFSDITQIDDYAYSMRLEELTYETEVDREWIEDQVRYIGSEAYGIAGGEEFILYLPDTLAEGLNEEFLT